MESGARQAAHSPQLCRTCNCAHHHPPRAVVRNTTCLPSAHPRRRFTSFDQQQGLPALEEHGPDTPVPTNIQLSRGISMPVPASQTPAPVARGVSLPVGPVGAYGEQAGCAICCLLHCPQVQRRGTLPAAALCVGGVSFLLRLRFPTDTPSHAVSMQATPCLPALSLHLQPTAGPATTRWPSPPTHSWTASLLPAMQWTWARPRLAQRRRRLHRALDGRRGGQRLKGCGAAAWGGLAVPSPLVAAASVGPGACGGAPTRFAVRLPAWPQRRCRPLPPSWLPGGRLSWVRCNAHLSGARRVQLYYRPALCFFPKLEGVAPLRIMRACGSPAKRRPANACMSLRPALFHYLLWEHHVLQL